MGGLEELSKEREEEISHDVGTSERRRITVDTNKDAAEIAKEHGVSRTTAWRAKQRGWLYKDYHLKLVDLDAQWAQDHVEEINASAKSGARIALAKLGSSLKEIQPWDFDDLVSVARLRLVELSGHPDRDSQAWRTVAARNSALDFIKTQVISAGKVFESSDELEKAEKI